MRRKENSKVKSISNIKQNIKGITLIALVVTIVILLILATVTINLAVGQNGLFGRAKNTVNAYKIAEANESQSLSEVADEMDIASGKQVIKDVSFADAKSRDPATSTTVAKVPDDYGNIIYVPVGFSIVTDSLTKVTDGVVISDVAGDDLANSKGGNQFVWIPLGTISTTATGSNDKTITLGRYTFDTTNGTPTLVQNAADYKMDVPIDTDYHELETSTYGNATAKSLSSFITSATSKRGYYLARYEAGVVSGDTNKCVSKYNQTVYTNSQPDAANVARGMYSTVNSDLVNSYAWDTAIVFIEQCGTESNHSNYANQIGFPENNQIGTTGTKKLETPNVIDKQCNIYDMSGNVDEWTTESGSSSDYPCVSRGNDGEVVDCTASRSGAYIYSNYGFRSLLYL